jgi:ABC-2 type transport system permease protein
MASSTLVVVGAKKRMLDNIVGQVRRHVWIHVIAGLVTLAIVVALGGTFFWFLFRFLTLPQQEPFGRPLMERLLGIVLLAFFSMLVFSNLIITLTTTYISKETEYLITLPIRFPSLFLVKLVESVFYSSWAFALLSLPLVIAYGAAKGAPLPFYPIAFLMGMPFLVIPAALGALVTMLISAYLPARKARLYSLVLLGAALVMTALLVRLMGLRSMIINPGVEDFTRIMQLLNAGSVPLLPNYWLARGMAAASAGGYAEAGYWFLVLLSTALMAVQTCLWLAPSLYYKGWALAKESASPVQATARRSVFHFLDHLFRPFTPPVRALLSKDLRTFWRDPAQWSQLVILFGLLVIYIANIQGLSKQLRGIDYFIKQWPTILSFFNVGAVCFVLSILTTRFVYPMLSLEGKQYWVVGLAPFPKEKLVWEKYGICLFAALVVALPLMAFSNLMLDVRPLMAWLGLVTVVFLALGLTSLAVGLGAIFPEFREDNPARIANGLGGTVNILLSLFYVVANLALEVPLAFHLTAMLERKGGAQVMLWSEAVIPVLPLLFGLLVVNAAVICVPIWLGIRNWRRMEFHL